MVVYPRWRGEHRVSLHLCPAFRGLSPLARGTPVFANLWTIAIRFIPAGAGNTGARNTKPCICSVYPRWRGEHVHTQTITESQNGLSPLARGTRFCLRYLLLCLRFIPAGAGNTRASTSSGIMIPVYPRWRGEHSRQHVVRNHDSGLSPLARGTRLTDMIGPRQRRFIPAGAGNTALGPGVVLAHAVYPRWRGEHGAVGGFGTCCIGLSPLARGTPLGCYPRRDPVRFIPAGAGNTSLIHTYCRE